LNGEPIKKFVFQVQVQAQDVGMLNALQDFLGFGSIRYAPSQRSGWQPTYVYTINSLLAHQKATIPFVERYMFPCAKRDQFEVWKHAIEDYIERHKVRWGRGRSVCSEEECHRPVRGRGLCRRHYYRVTGW
jgi:hypothetical protein